MVTYGQPILKHSVQIDTNAEQREIHEKLNWFEKAIKHNQNPLDRITDQELNKKLQALKFKKACGPDGILNEMLKTH